MTNIDPAASLAARFADVKARIAAAAQGCGRSPDEVTLIAISKTHPASLIKELIELGATDLGENRVQEAAGKMPGRDLRYTLDYHDYRQPDVKSKVRIKGGN